MITSTNPQNKIHTPIGRTTPNSDPDWKLTSLYTRNQLNMMGIPTPKKGEKFFQTHEDSNPDYYHRFEICVLMATEENNKSVKGTYGDVLFEYWYRNIEFRD